ncbi:MAG: YfhO family protein [Aggregatilineales bacterium]
MFKRDCAFLIGIPALLALLTALFMIAVFRPPTGREFLDGHDLVNQQYPLWSFIFDNVRDGHGLPLWDPYLFAGQSVATNPQAALAYPPLWLMIPLGVPRAAGWLAALHLWFGGWGMAWFTRRMGASPFGALCGAIVYEFSAVLSAHLGAGHLNYLLCQAWLPWIAVAYLWAVERRGRHSLLTILTGAVALGLCALTGYPPLLYFAGIWLVGLWLYTIFSAHTDRVRVAFRAMRPLIGITVGGAILGAATLLPTAQLTLGSTRTQQSGLAFSNSYALPGGQTITLLFPNLFGYPKLPDQGYWGLPFYEEVTTYVGILPLLAIFLVRRRPASVLLGVFVIGGLIVSLGIDGGLFPALYWLVPGYSLFRVPSRALYFFVVGAAGLTALVVTDLESMTADERRERLRIVLYRALPLLGGFAVIASFALMAYYTTHSADTSPPWRTLFSGNMAGIAAIAIGTTWLILRLWSSSEAQIGRSWRLALTMGVLLLDLWHISWPMITVSAIDVPDEWELLAQVAPAAPDFRVMTVPNNVDWQAAADYTHHLNADGYDPLVGSAYQTLLTVSQHNPTSPIAGLLGVRYVLSHMPYEWSKMSGIDHLTLLKQSGDWYVYQVHDPLPRAFVATNVQVAADDQALSQLSGGIVDPLTTAFVDRSVACVTGDSAGSAQAQPATITHYESNTVEVDANSPTGGLFVLTDSYDSDWQVTVDNVPATLLRTDTALRGVCIPAGTHQVRFVYQPSAFWAGVAISAGGWLIVGLIGLIIGFRSIRTLRKKQKDIASTYD